MTLADRKSDLPPFSKIAYNNLGNDKLIVGRLNRELETWMKSKKGVDELIKRIATVTNMDYNHARTVARTERTRVQGQSRYEAIRQQNRALPYNQRHYRKQWVARDDSRTRDTHAELSGTVVPATQYFITKVGTRLMYPGDPRAPVEEVINCRCYIRRAQPK